ncbi:tRNA pseudouridine(38/39) synthase isoform X2 [Rosa chinensis]|uniref:tRNA pseudouridine(38/39) synthase isoform X2 n=1 Tax=Rosa chinensis TaxID=74649 RepID=UPI001AD8C378|nr:tRNA pseudouridine(38/39) synthase isoform X2 [Rosa chinensis]
MDVTTVVDSLRHRVQELEALNAKLSSQLAVCHCHQDKTEVSSVSSDNLVEKSGKSSFQSKNTTKEKLKGKLPGYDTRIMNHHSKRYVALKVMYFGQRFYGFAAEAQMDPTIESEIFKALEKTRLLIGDKKESHYSRCGRTDKGVSAVGQVIALYLRSNLKEACEISEDPSNQEQYDACLFPSEGEIDYVRVLNRVLPDDIRVFGWYPVPLGFSARFSCLSREYYYLFWGENLNFLAMETAGRKFVGEHDFRNFCKMDALNVHNYRRKITSFAMSPCDVRFEGNQLWAFKIKGSAFLWHQVRCMVAVLLLIGQGHESPDVIDALLDTDRIPRKPQYGMAPEIPLVLQSCEFEGLKFICSSDARQALRIHLAHECRNYHLQAAIFNEALQCCFPVEKGAEDQRSLDNGTMKKKSSHVPLMSRPTEPSYEERRAKLNTRACRLKSL